LVTRDAAGYAQLGWINTTSGVTTSTIDKIYASSDDYIRYVTPATLISQLGLWTSSNDGGGSGLDADLLDGLQFSSFLRSDVADTFTGSSLTINAPLHLTTYTESVNTSTVTTGTKVLNLTDDTVFNLTLNSGTQIQFTNAPAGKAVSVTLVCKQDGTGNRQLTYANNVVFTDGNVPTMSSTGGNYDVLTFLTVDGGGTYIGSHSILNAS
jgi:hypothetical protein